MNLSLDGASLTIAATCAVARAQTSSVSLASGAIARMQASRALVDRLAAGDDPIYAVNTGVGLLADVRIPREDLDQLQRNVIRSHCDRGRRPAGARSGARHDADPRQRAGQRLLRHPAAGGRAPLRSAEPRRHSGSAVAGQRGRIGRPGAARAHGARADRRRRSRVRGRYPARRRGAAARRNRSHRPAPQGRHQPDQRHPGDAGHRLPGTRGRRSCWRTPPTWSAP